MQSSELHRKAAEGQGSVPIAIVTVSDTRTPETDVSGRLIRELAEAAGHRVVDYRIVKDEPDQVLAALNDFAGGQARPALVAAIARSM
jgi:molybdenum cofactor biosynthesis protein B